MIRTKFPLAGETYEGGISDGWEYRVVFTGNRLADVYAMVQAFLQEQGYGHVPVPATAEELRLFKTLRKRQPGLFDLAGYVHNPLKILFLPSKGKRISLVLQLYNEHADQHLLRFHGLV